MTDVVIGCNKRVLVDEEAFGARLLEQFGPEVMDTLARMAEAGAFGKALPQ